MGVVVSIGATAIWYVYDWVQSDLT